MTTVADAITRMRNDNHRFMIFKFDGTLRYTSDVAEAVEAVTQHRMYVLELKSDGTVKSL